MKRLQKICLQAACALLTMELSVRAEEPASFGPPLDSFLKQHCYDCHGSDLQEAGLNLESVPRELNNPDAMKLWVKVLDKVAAGKMSPPEATQPGKEDSQSFTRELSRTLHNASLRRQEREGRVVLRRLNRNEYETTLRDLLGTQVDVKDLLPDDGTAAGFDNVSRALDVSSVHLLRYQQAAEQAVRSVVPSRAPTKTSSRYTGREITEKVRTFKGCLDKSVRLDGEKLILHSRTYDSVPCSTARVTQPGRYRMRASLSVIGMDVRTLPVMITHHGHRTKENKEARRVRDIPAGKTTVISEEFELDGREIVVLNPWSLPSPRELERVEGASPLADYSGAGLVVHWIEIEGPLDEFPSPGYQRLFGDVPLVSTNPRDPTMVRVASENPHDDAERLIRNVLPVIFRRPVDDSLADYFIGIAQHRLDVGDSFVDAMVGAYTAVFCSPHFLYLNELLQDDPIGKRTELDAYAVATRLSYLLWSSTPDEELLELASQGTLKKPDVLHTQVERMLKDPKSQRFTENFAGQWLDLRNINETSPDPQVYGEFDDVLYWSMPRETQLFFNEVLTRDLSISEFVDSDWSFLNQRLAQHYGIAGVVGGELRKVKLPKQSHRGGVLTQAAILKVTADGSKTSPVLRGAWVLERIVGLPPDPPPPNTPAIDPDVRGTTTVRQQLDKHRNIAACASCHQHIDPPGFALESFDAIGGWRTFYRGGGKQREELANYPGQMVSRGLDVELGGSMPDGRSFDDIDQYRQILAEDEDQLARNVAEKLIIYATGAEIEFADREVVEQLVAQARRNNYGFRSLLHSVVQSRLFLSK